MKVFNSNDNIKDGDISLLTFNTNGFGGLKWTKNPVSSQEIIAFIKAQDADIVCLQESGRSINRQFENYPYKYQTPFNSTRSSQAILSKYPIISNGSLELPNTANNVIYVDVLYKKDTLRVYNLHLQSFKVRASSFKREQPQRLFKRMNKSFLKQQKQAKLVREHVGQVDYRKIICGDFNNTQFSSLYNTIKGEMNDTFLEKGSGFGSTYNFKFLPYRIDFILADLEFDIKSHKNFDVRLSDHTPVMASFRLKE